MFRLIIVAKIVTDCFITGDVMGAPLAPPDKRLSRFSNAPWMEVPLPLSVSGPLVNVPVPLPLPLPLGLPPSVAPTLSSFFLCNWHHQGPYRTYPAWNTPPISAGDPWDHHHPPWWKSWRDKPLLPRPPCPRCGKPSPPPSSSAAPSPAPPADAATDAPPPDDAGGEDSSAEEPSIDNTEDDGRVVTVNGNGEPTAAPGAPADPPAEEQPAEESPAEQVPAEEPPAEQIPAEEQPAEEPLAEQAPASPTEEAPAESGGENVAAALTLQDQSGEETSTGNQSDLPPEGSLREESEEAITKQPADGAVTLNKNVFPAGSFVGTAKRRESDEIPNEVPNHRTSGIDLTGSPAKPLT